MCGPDLNGKVSFVFRVQAPDSQIDLNKLLILDFLSNRGMSSK